MERRLATIQTILDVLPHNNADSLEIVKVLGWTLVVLKGQFQKDQTVVFIEPDAVLPEGRPEWEFMRSRHFRVKTIRLRGVISQGLVFPITDTFPVDLSTIPPANLGPFMIGDDVTEKLGITKYEPYVPADLAGIVKGNFPQFLHKTDETRIQAVPELIKNRRGMEFLITEKVDGTSFTAYLNNGEFGVCSRNLELTEDDTNTYWKVARGLELHNRLTRACETLGYKNLAIQGELIGNGIQKNKYNLHDIQLKVFNVFDIDRGRHLDAYDYANVLVTMRLDPVPGLGRITFDENTTVESLIEFSKGFSKLNPKTPREGLVFRPEVETYDQDLRGRLSFKVINPEFLLKYDE